MSGIVARENIDNTSGSSWVVPTGDSSVSLSTKRSDSEQYVGIYENGSQGGAKSLNVVKESLAVKSTESIASVNK